MASHGGAQRAAPHTGEADFPANSFFSYFYMKRFLIPLAALLLATAQPARAQQAPADSVDHSFSVAKALDILNSAFLGIDLYYVDTLDMEQLAQEAIDAMLDRLDIYSEYFPAEDIGDLKMMTTGKYGGIGSIIRQRRDSTGVCIGEPYEGMPAAEAGLQVGDLLKRIDKTDLKGKSVSQVSEMLRGEPGTSFQLTLLRPGETKERTVTLTRRNVKTPAVTFSGMVSPTVGYIGLTQFTEDCSVEVLKALTALKAQGAKALVLDLRGNGGGLLNEAVSVVNLFVPKGLKVVETKGKVQAANSTYLTTDEPADLELPVCVLVNSGTASSAEIVAGSLQDFDRAVVVGGKTYGKGLVQSPRPLPYDGNLKLTTSKYYIPSGRCIQAIDYKRIREQGGNGRVPDSLAHEFHTQGGRPVRDSGGIRPDVEVKHDTVANIALYLSQDDVLLDWGTEYVQTHKRPASVADFSLTDADVAHLLDMARASGFKYDRLSQQRLDELKKMAKFEGYYDEAKPEFDALEAKLRHDLAKDFAAHDRDIRLLMAQEVTKRWFFQRGAVEESLKGDEDLEKALSLLGDPAQYRALLSPAQP